MEDIFAALPACPGIESIPDFRGKLEGIHQQIQREMPVICRLSVILYDEEMNLMKTFIHTGENNSLSAYTCSLDRAGSLRQMVRLRQARVVNDLNLFSAGRNRHTRAIAGQGIRSSLSVPLFKGEDFAGVAFFNAYEPQVFTEKIIDSLCLYAQLINSLVVNKLAFTRMLVGTFRGALGMVSYKDPETGSHLDRMARYARLIARHLAVQGCKELDDETIEHIFLFAPLHDIGKIGIPDSILRKPGRLDDSEWTVMQTHSEKGREIIDSIADHLGLTEIPHIQLLRNISGAHHETIDGQGYPDRLKQDEIPMETQIVTVADIFDALTSERPYKAAWTFDQAFRELDSLAGKKLNPGCVDALKENRAEALEIRERFKDQPG